MPDMNVQRTPAPTIRAINARAAESPRALTLAAAAARYSVSPRQIYRWRESGALRVSKVGRRVFVEVAVIERFLGLDASAEAV